MKLNFKGPLVPVFTPFYKDSGAVNIDVIPKYADYLAKAGIIAVLVNGTAGEGVSMTVEERKLVAEEWIKVAKIWNMIVMIQVGGTSLKEVQELAKHAENLNADAILCLPDLFFRPKSVKDLTHYLQFVSKAAPKTPLFYYHIPSFTGVTLDMAEFLRHGKDQIQTLAGIKFTHTNLQEGAECLTVNSEEFTVFLGNEVMLAGACVQGFDSCIVIALNLVPNIVMNLMECVQKNDSKKAMEYQQKLTSVINRVQKNGYLPGTKAATSFITGLEMGDLRLPQISLTSEQLLELKKELVDLNLVI
ncbi:N-acetylneuraminate lyase-like [Lycorma delicatula]|uniref:N-acetylneuraminate lyase-like n=1 Tax=Lycorma delicatula TaxID=130591 RepID=UPI003F5120BF